MKHKIAAAGLLSVALAWGQQGPEAEQQIVRWFQEAREAQAQGDLATAEAGYRRILRLRPEIAELHSNLGLVLYLQGRCPEALETFRQALSRNPRLFVPKLFSGICYGRLHQPRKAVPLLEGALDVRPADPKALLHLGVSYANAGEPGRALAPLERLVAIHPASEEALYHLGATYLELSIAHYERLRTMESGAWLYFRTLAALDRKRGPNLSRIKLRCEQAVAARPGYPNLHWSLARVLLADGDGDGARQALEKEVQISPEHVPALLLLAEICRREGDSAAGRSLLGRVDQVARSAPRSDAAFARLVDEDPARALGLLNAALELESLGSSADILAIPPVREMALTVGRLRSLAADDPGDDWKLEVYARCRMRGHGFRGLAREIGQWAAAHRDWAMPHFLLGEIYQRLSEQILGRLEQAAPAGYRALMLRAELLEHQNKDKQAIQAYRQAVRLKPDLPGLHYRLAVVLGREWMLEEAEAALKRELEIDPLNALARVRLGEVYVHREQHAEAIAVLNEALAQDAGLVSAYDALGRAYQGEGNLEAAARMFEKALELGPEDRGLHYRLARLYQRLGRTQEFRRHLARFRRLLEEEAEEDGVRRRERLGGRDAGEGRPAPPFQ